MTNKTRIRKPLLRAVAVIAPAAVLAAMIAVGPSFAGSFLTHRQAVKTFLKKKEAAQQFLTEKAASKQFLAPGDVPPQPFVRSIASTADSGPFVSKTPYDIPGARATFKTESTTSDVLITFTGSATCTASSGGVPCQVQVLVDGYATQKVNFLTSTAGSPQPKETVHTFVQPGIVTPGKHVISVRYAGSSDASVGFKVFDFNLLTQVYPGSEIPPETEE